MINDEVREKLFIAWAETLHGRKTGLGKSFRADGFTVVHGAAVNVKGARYYEAAMGAYESSVLCCALEPENKHDDKAIKVMDADGETVGHLADGSDYREKVRDALESGSPVYAIVTLNEIEDLYGQLKVFLVAGERHVGT